MERFNFYCEVFFVLEMVVKLLGLGFKAYANDNYNISDAILVSTTLIEWIIELNGNTGLKSLMIARATRLLRVLKLARQWTAFHNLLRWFGIAFKEATNFMILLLIFQFIFILLGMEFYAHLVHTDDATGENIDPYGNGPPPRVNFDTWTNSLTALFIFIIGDDWQYVMYDHYRAMKTPLEGYLTIIFFSNLFFALNLMMLNLLLAILLKSHAIKPTEDQILDEAEKEEEAGDIGPVYVCLYSCKIRMQKCCVKFLKREKEQEQEKVVETSPLKKDTTYTVENMFGIDASQITDTSMITEADLQGKGNQIKTEKYLASPKPTDDI